MGYQIEYNLMEMKKTKLKKKIPFWKKAVLLAGSFFLCHFLLVLLQTAMGGQWTQTIAASEKMVDALQNGKSLKDAVQVFCVELIP